MQPSRKQYTHIKCDYAITLHESSSVERVDDCDASDIVTMKYNFVPIGSLLEVDEGEYVDVIGAVATVSDLFTIRSKRGNKLTKREVKVCK